MGSCRRPDLQVGRDPATVEPGLIHSAVMPSKRAAATLTARDFAPLLRALQTTNRAVAVSFPGEPGDRQPVHTVYGGAHLFKFDTARKLGTLALAALDEYAPDAATFGRALGLETGFADTVRARVV